MKRLICSVVAALVLLNISLNVFATEFSTQIQSKALLLMESSSGKILYESNSHQSLPPASITKVMTMLLICEALERKELSLDTIITASERAKSMGGSTIFLDTGEEMTLKDMLKGIAVASANDACVAVAEHMCGSVESFVEKMNTRAKELGMKDTNFVNCNGLDVENHVTSAYDIAIMSRELLKHPNIHQYTTIWMDSLRNGQFQLANTNKLVRFYDGATGLKTGSTSNAGCCITATAKRDGMHLIAVVLGCENSKDRFNLARELLDYGFGNYSVTNFGEKGTEVIEVKIINGKTDSLIARTSKNAGTVISKNDKENLRMHLNLPKELSAPVKKGQVIGELLFTLNGETLEKTELVSDRTVNRMSAGDYFLKMIKSIFLI